MFVFHLQEQRNHPRDYQLERCLALSLLQNAFFPSLNRRSLWSEGCKETANSWQGCNCGEDCKKNPFLPLEKCTKYTVHLEILSSADCHGQNHRLLLRVLLHTLSRLCHLLHFSDGKLLRAQNFTHGLYPVCNFSVSHAPTSAPSKFPNFLLRFIWAEITGIDQLETRSWDKTIYVDTHNWEQFFCGKRLNLSLRRENLAP